MDSLLFSLAPDELLLTVLNYSVDCDHLFQMISFHNDRMYNNSQCLILAREKVSYQTGLRTNQFNMDKLKDLSKFRFARNIHAGNSSSFTMTNNGKIYASGQYNRKPDNLFEEYNSKEGIPTIIPELDNIIHIAGITGETFFLKSNEYQNSLHLCGTRVDGTYSMIDKNTIFNIDDIVQVSPGWYYLLLLTSKGTVYQKKYNIISPTLLDLDDIIQVSAGHDHCLFLTSDGNVYSLGCNEYGQLGVDTSMKSTNNPILIPNMNNIVQIVAGNSFSLLLNADGYVYMFGSQDGALERGYIPILLPVDNIIQISAINHCLLLRADGTVYGFGWNHFGQLGLNHTEYKIYIPTIIPELNNIISVSAGFHHSMVLDKDGQIYVFGDNNAGQLGLSDNENRSVPVINPYFHI